MRAWVSLLAAALATGLVLAAIVMFQDARREVDTWLAAPAAPPPTTVWSAPLRLAKGDPLRAAPLAEDLRAAGYEEGAVDRADRFLIQPAGDADFTLEVQTGHDEGGALTRVAAIEVPARRARVEVAQGRVRALWTLEGERRLPLDELVLRPTRLGHLGDLERRRDPVRLDELSPHMVPALLAIEDARFMDHPGVDPIGLTRALLSNLLGGPVQGGSTLTQQLAKNLFLAQDRTLRRKAREAFLAAALESRFTKDELLALYLSEVYLGHDDGMPVYGVEAAARAWFGKGAAHLDAAEAATIAGTIASPNQWSPLRDPEAARARRDVVIGRMRFVRALTDSQADAALTTPLTLAPDRMGAAWRLPWPVTSAVDEAAERLGDRWGDGQGLTLITSAQPHLQRAVQDAVARGLTSVTLAHPEARTAEVAVAVLRASDGAIVATVGGRDWARSPFDRARKAWREAGSTVKPLIALAAMHADPSLGPGSALPDAPRRIVHDGEAWSPRNYDGNFLGEVSLHRALVTSRNLPAVHLAGGLGWATVQDRLQAVGLTRATALPSASLGGFPTTVAELAAAYAVFVRGGVWRAPRHVLSASSVGARTGPGTAGSDPSDVLLAANAPGSPYATAAEAAVARHLLEAVLTEGTGRGARQLGLQGAVGGKTGTTDGARDAWFVGFDPTYVVAVWVGPDRGELGLTGGEAALPIWVEVMRALGAPHGAFRDPDGVVTVAACPGSDRPACPGTPCAGARPVSYLRGHLPACVGPGDAAGPPTGPGSPGAGAVEGAGSLRGDGERVPPPPPSPEDAGTTGAATAEPTPSGPTRRKAASGLRADPRPEGPPSGPKDLTGKAEETP